MSILHGSGAHCNERAEPTVGAQLQTTLFRSLIISSFLLDYRTE